MYTYEVQLCDKFSKTHIRFATFKAEDDLHAYLKIFEKLFVNEHGLYNLPGNLTFEEKLDYIHQEYEHRRNKAIRNSYGNLWWADAEHYEKANIECFKEIFRIKDGDEMTVLLDIICFKRNGKVIYGREESIERW